MPDSSEMRSPCNPGAAGWKASQLPGHSSVCPRDKSPRGTPTLLVNFSQLVFMQEALGNLNSIFKQLLFSELHVVLEIPDDPSTHLRLLC